MAERQAHKIPAESPVGRYLRTEREAKPPRDFSSNHIKVQGPAWARDHQQRWLTELHVGGLEGEGIMTVAWVIWVLSALDCSCS